MAFHPLVNLVRQRLDGRDDDRVAGVDAQRIDVLHRADRDAGVVRVAHHLVLDLLPADEAALDHDLADRAGAEAGANPLAVFLLGLDDAAARPAERERGPDDRREADVHQGSRLRGGPLLEGAPLDDERRRIRLPDPIEQVPERLPILGHPDGLERRPEQPDVMALEDAGPGEVHRHVQGRLATETGEQALRLLAGDDRFDGGDRQGLEVDRVRNLRVGHDRGRVRVDQDRAHALRAQRATRLGAGVVELRRLPDHDRPRADDQHGSGFRRGPTAADVGLGAGVHTGLPVGLHDFTPEYARKCTPHGTPESTPKSMPAAEQEPLGDHWVVASGTSRPTTSHFVEPPCRSPSTIGGRRAWASSKVACRSWIRTVADLSRPPCRR